MKKTVLSLLFVTFYWGAVLLAQSNFEGTLTTKVSVAGVDMSQITEKIDYNKGDLSGQMAALYKNIPANQVAKLQALMEENPMMGLAILLTPPKATIRVKNKIAAVTTRGLGYEIQHYHNSGSDEAFLYTKSLIQPEEEVTAFYKPSAGYETLFTEDKRITTDRFNVERLAKTATVAGYPCDIAVYTPKSSQPQSNSGMGLPQVEVRKLVVYSGKDMPKGINFSHPYYLPEDHGVMRIDIYLDNGSTPTMIYEVVSVDKVAVRDDLLAAKKTEPLYALNDMQYGMKLLGIMMGGMAALNAGDDDGTEAEAD